MGLAFAFREASGAGSRRFVVVSPTALVTATHIRFRANGTTLPRLPTSATSLYRGSWQVARRIVHFDDGRVWTFTGRVDIDARSFVEEGTMITEGVSVQPCAATTASIWTRRAKSRCEGSTAAPS